MKEPSHKLILMKTIDATGTAILFSSTVYSDSNSPYSKTIHIQENTRFSRKFNITKHKYKANGKIRKLMIHVYKVTLEESQSVLYKLAQLRV